MSYHINRLVECGLALGLLSPALEESTIMAIPEDDYYQQDAYQTQQPHLSGPESANGLNQWLLAITLVLIMVVAVAVGYTLHEQGAAQKLVSANSELAAELTRTQAQLAGVNAKLSALSASEVQPAPPADENWDGKSVASQAAADSRVHRPASRRVAHPATSVWQRNMQQQLSEQQVRLSSAEEAVAKTQSDLASNAANTRNSLGVLGDTIARNHAELVTLQELGKRNYFEFDLTKTKKFAHEGPVSLALRHTSAKRQNYDMDLLVDDFKLSKKHVDLYEPLVFETSESPQPLELVVNKITKIGVHGYISVPKSYGQRAPQPVVTAASGQPASSIAVSSSAQAAPTRNAGSAQIAAATPK